MKKVTLLLCTALLLLGTSINVQSQNSDTRVEISEERTENSNTYLLPNGLHEKVISGGATNYLLNGQWETIEPALVYSNNSYENTKNSIQSFFPAISTSSSVIDFKFKGLTIQLEAEKKMLVYSSTTGFNILPQNYNGSAAIVEDNKIQYPQIYTGINDEYEIGKGLIKNNLILDYLPTAILNINNGYYGFQETITLPTNWSIVPIHATNNLLIESALEILNDKGELEISIPAPIFFDNDGPGTDGSSMIEGKYHLNQQNGKWVLTTLVPVDWLKDANRNYPITIDPTLTVGGTIGGWQSPVNSVDNNGFVFIGVCCSNGIHRAYIKFNTSSIPDNSCITNTELQIYVNGVGGSGVERVHCNNTVDPAAMWGPYGGIVPAAFTDFGNGWYTSFDLTTAGTYGYYDLGPMADADLQGQLTLDWFQPALIFDNEPSTAWKRLTGNLCNLRVTYSAPPCVLPVELLDFTAECKQTGVELNWSTATEIENDYFELEKSIDGNEYTTIAIVDGAGSSSIIQNYSFIDDANAEELVYYRLKQIDFNGAITYHDVISSKCNTKGFEVISSSIDDYHLELLIQNYTNQQVTFNLYSSTGQELMTKTIQLVAGNNHIRLNDISLVSGIYFLSINNGTTNTSIKLIND